MTNNSSKQEILVFVFIIVLMAGSIFGVKYYKKTHQNDNNQNIQEKKEEITRVLLYHNDNSTYKIVQENEYISIKSESDLDCDVVDCNELDIPTTEITEPEIKKEVTNLLDELFKNERSTFLEVSNNDLTIDQISSLEIIINSLEEEDLTYTINKSKIKEPLTKRGYAIVEESNKAIVLIGMGEKNTGGYSIDISKVITSSNTATIYVKETSPKPGDVVTQAFTYPTVQIEFNRKPEKIIVINEETKNYYSEVEIKEIEYKYNILQSSNNSNYPKTGYIVEQTENGFTITIAMGEKKTGGYSISIEKVEINNNKANIFVKEKKPGAIAIDVLTYPIVQITFNELPKEVHIINTDTKTEYQEIKKEEQ